MFNPYEYDDQAYRVASNNLSAAIQAYWFAGASLENLEDDITDFIQDSDFDA